MIWVLLTLTVCLLICRYYQKKKVEAEYLTKFHVKPLSA